MSVGQRAERLFAELCNRQFLRGFVFHSPRFNNPDESEAGDVVLWVRRQVIVIEMLARDAEPGTSTEQFVKRIGNKRRQLVRDYNAFTDPSIDIELVNEQGEQVEFDTRDLSGVGFSGIILLDCDDHLEKPHFKTILKSLELPFPVAVMTKQDFLDILSEIDTVPDLTYYLNDRADFLRQVYEDQAQLFLDLNCRLEKNLMSFYKLYENNFPISEWDLDRALEYHQIYQVALEEEIEARNAENANSRSIDEIIDALRSNNEPSNSTLLHSWELASLTRRQRSAVAPKINDAIERMIDGNSRRRFAFYNQVTGCWLVFFFQFGGDAEAFRKRAVKLTRYKLFVEMEERDFQYSVFGYGFRKSSIDTGATFDDIVLTIEDAESYDSVPTTQYQRALQYFGGNEYRSINEFS